MTGLDLTKAKKTMSHARTYKNPVYDRYFADPFVWRHDGVYYAVGTGSEERDEKRIGRAFPLLRSHDFVHWEFRGGALERPDPALGGDFWAPEVAYDDGTFYLYYSVGEGDKGHQLRAAASASPEGPYVDTGQSLIDPASCPFAIDPHPFRDDDGQWYLFYARDFLNADDEHRAGTALAADRLVTMTRLAGDERVVLRARHDWQRFLANRTMYGQVWDWHTLEGACVRKHEGRYYCFYSGAAWTTENYGVDYGVADHPLGPYSDDGGETMPRVLRSVPGHVRGPGHNSIVVGPDNQTEYLIYHSWDEKARERRMCIDKLIWTPEGPRCQGPTWTPQTL